MNADQRRQRTLAMHRDYETGLTMREVAERFGVDRKTVELSFDRYGLPKRVARSRRADWREQHRLRALEMQRLYERGLTIAEVADHFGVDRNTVDRSFARYDLSKRAARSQSGRWEQWYPDVE